MRKIKFEIQLSGAPYPFECWWRIRGSNGRILVSSELMGKKNATRVINNIVKAIKGMKFTVDKIQPGALPEIKK